MSHDSPSNLLNQLADLVRSTIQDEFAKRDSAHAQRDAESEALNTAQAADMLDMSANTLEAWRRADKGPPYRRYGRRVVYDRAEVVNWAEAQRRATR